MEWQATYARMKAGEVWVTSQKSELMMSINPLSQDWWQNVAIV
jgi:hypothetical protein